ncbi:MAG: hypothetical protein AAFR61_03500 [Bacteroidota bacterium]
MKTSQFFILLFLTLFSTSIMAQDSAIKHEFKVGVDQAFLTTGDERTPALYNQYVLSLKPRWGLVATGSFVHSTSFTEGNLLNQEGFPPANFVSTDYHVSDLAPNFDQQTIIWLDIAPQFKAILGLSHQFSISAGPSVGYFNYATIANLEIGTFSSPIRTSDITLIEYRHTRGIDVGGHFRLAYDYLFGEHFSLGVQGSTHFFANGDYVYGIGANLGFRL